MGNRRFALLLAMLLSLVSPVVGHTDLPDEPTYAEHFFSSGDGTSLHAGVFLPASHRSGQRHPVVLVVSPYLNGGPSGDRVVAYRELHASGGAIDRGYAVVQVSLRGYGGSGGCSDLGGKGEQADVKAAVEWAAGQSWSTGKVGMWGVSYDAWTQVMALATKPKGLAALIVQAPLLSLYRGLYMNGAHYTGGWLATPAVYGALDLVPPDVSDQQQVRNAVLGAATNPQCYAANATLSALSQDPAGYWAERDLVGRAQGSRVPVFWSHGFQDANTKPDNFVDVFRTLRGPRRGWFGQFKHINSAGSADRGEAWANEAMRWLDRFVKGVPERVARVTRDPGAVVQQQDGQWRAENAWPPADARAYPLGLRAGTYPDVAGHHAYGGTRPPGTAVYTASQHLPYDVHLSGVARVAVQLTSPAPATVVALVYDVEPEGNATLVTRGVAAGVGPGTVSFELYPQDWRFEAGHRIVVALSGADETWWAPPHSGGAVTVGSATLNAPFLRYDRNRGVYRRWLAGDTNVASLPPAITLDTDELDAAEVQFRLPPRLAVVQPRPSR